MFWKRQTTDPGLRRTSFRPTLETLEAREVPAVAALGAAEPLTELAAVRYKSFANTGSREIYLGKPDLGVGANRSEVDFSWLKPGQYDIAFSYDGATALTTTVTPTGGTGGSAKSLSYTLAAPLNNLDAFEIVLADRHTGGQVNFLDVEVDGDAVGNFVGNDAFQSWKFTSDQLADGFTFTGTIHLSGTFSGGDERSRVEIKVGDAQVVPNVNFQPFDISANNSDADLFAPDTGPYSLPRINLNVLVDGATLSGQRPTGTVSFTAIRPSGSTTLGSAAIGPDGRATLVDVDSGLIGQPGVIVQAAYSGDAFFAAAVKNDGGANAAQAMADPPVNDNPQIPANAQNLTVVVVAGKNGVQRAEWRDSARAYYGANAYIITNVHSIADLGARLAELPAGSISRLVIGAHGIDEGAQLGNPGVAATRFNFNNLSLEANANARNAIMVALANNALIDLQACSCAKGEVGRENIQAVANLLRVRVRGADANIGAWDDNTVNWITANPQ